MNSAKSAARWKPFRDSARARQELETQAAEQRALSEAERARNDADKRSLDGQIDFAVNQLAAGLGRLAQGDVSQTIDTPFVGRLEQLRVDFNASLVRLQDTLVADSRQRQCDPAQQRCDADLGRTSFPSAPKHRPRAWKKRLLRSKRSP